MPFLNFVFLPKDDMLRKGSDLPKVYGNNGYVLAIWDENSPVDIGNKIQIGRFKVEIAGMLKYNPFSDNGSTDGEAVLICSEEAFTGLTGEQNYAIIDIQVTKDAT